MSESSKQVVLSASLKETISESLARIKAGFAQLATTGGDATQKLSSDVHKATGEVESHAAAVAKASSQHTGFAGVLARVKGALTETGGGLSDFAKGLLTSAGAMAAVQVASRAFDAVKEGLGECIQAGLGAEKTEAILNQTLADTGRITGVTKGQLDKLTESLLQHTTYSKDTIDSAEGVMAAFTQISSKVFPGAMAASANLAAKMGLDLPNAARLVGRALDNPTQGMLTLTRYGITLTANMKEQIATFLKHGQTAQAQGVILDALKTKFGGVAQAVADTTSGKLTIFNNQLEAMKEGIGLALLPVLSRLLDITKPVLATLGELLPGAMAGLSGFIQSAFMPSVNGVVTVFGKLWPSVEAAGRAFATALAPSLKNIGGLIQGVNPLMALLGDSLSTLSGTSTSSATQVASFGSRLVGFAQGIAQVLGPVIGLASAIGKLLGAALSAVMGLFGDFIGPLFAAKGGTESWGESLKNGLVAALATVTGWLQTFTTFLHQNSGAVTAVKVVLAILAGVLLSLASPVVAIIAGVVLLVAGFKRLWDSSAALRDILTTIGATVLALVKQAFANIQTTVGGLLPHLAELWAHFSDLASGVLNIAMPAFTVLTIALSVILPAAFAVLKTNLEVLQKVWETLWPFLAAIVGGFLGNLKIIFGTLFAFLGDIMGLIADLLHGRWGKIKDDVLKIVTDLLSGGRALFDNMRAMLSTIFSQLWSDIKNAASSGAAWLGNEWKAIETLAANTWHTITGDIGAAWNLILSTIERQAGTIKNAVLSPFQQAAAVIGGIMRGFGNSLIDDLNHGIKGGGLILDWLGQRLDDIAQKLIGSRPIPHFTFTNIPHFAKGTDSFAGGLALVGEEGPELVSLPRGSKVMPARETAAVLQGRVPAFAGGIGDILGDVGNFFSSRINDLKSAAAAAIGKVIAAVPFLGDVQKLGGVYGSLAGGAVKNIQSWGLHALQGWLANFGGGSSGVVTGGHMAGVLPGYLLMNQLALTDINKENDCVPTSLASAVSYDLKRVVSATSLKDAVYGAGYMGGQSPARYIPYLSRLGIALRGLTGGNGTLVSYLHRYLSAGIPVLGQIPSDWNNANSYGSTHEVAFAGQSNGKLIAMNPWRGFFQSAPDSWWMPRLRLGSIWPVTKMANGGIINEPVFGIGQSSGVGYLLGERGPETVTPGTPGTPGTGGNTIHITIQPAPVLLNGKQVGEQAGQHIVHHIRSRTGHKL